MTNYLTITRELKKADFWNKLSGNEIKILLDLLFKAPYKATTYNLYGMEIELEKYELCFSSVKLARFYGVTVYGFRTLLKKFERLKLLELKNRKVSGENSTDKSTIKSTDNGMSKCNNRLTSITFCGWVFGHVSMSENESLNESRDAEFQQSNQETNHEHNKEVFNQESQTNNTRAAGVKNVNQKQKTWYPLDRIASLDFPYADELVGIWCEHGGVSRLHIIPLLNKYLDEQRFTGLTEMSIDFLDYRFKIYIKQQIKTRKKGSEPPRNQNYL